MKILFAASEAYPFIMTGGLGEVVGALPKSLMSLDTTEKNDVKVIIPLYSNIPMEYRSKMTFLGSVEVRLSWRVQYCGIFYYRLGAVDYYFVDNEYYFKRKRPYGEFDDGERFAFFSKSVLELLRAIDFVPDIIHCHDWHTALVPIYLNIYYKKIPEYSNIKTIFTIHNIQYQGIYAKSAMQDVFDIPAEYASLMDYNYDINLMKGAIVCADFVGTVSPTYAEEIQDEFYAYGLEYILRDNKWKLKGILNGIDTDSYNPDKDKDIPANYDQGDLTGKVACKEEIQKAFGLQPKKDVPLIGMVSRIVGHKGFDLVRYIIPELMSRDVQMVILGTGERKMERALEELATIFPGKLSLRVEFNGKLSRRVYAGSDIFLMPSKSEPCGLAQMIALRYGTVPVVRQTGGLKDSIIDYGDEGGTGFTFKSYNAHDMLGAVDRALGLYADKEQWNKLIRHDMAQNLSWDSSAAEYLRLYKKICGKDN